MFDRAFFEQDFLKQVRAFAQSQNVAAPVVELLLDDGSLIYVKRILQVKERWVALNVHDDEERQLFCPYYSIKRLSFYKAPPKSAKSKDLGFAV